MKGECDDESLVECSNDVELKHGLDDNTVAYAVYADSSCKTLYLATFYPYGCDGDGFKEFCEGDGELFCRSVHFILLVFAIDFTL